MKARLEFELPEQELEYQMSLGGVKFFTALKTFNEYLLTRYKNRYPTPEVAACFEEVMARYAKILELHRVDFNDPVGVLGDPE